MGGRDAVHERIISQMGDSQRVIDLSGTEIPESEVHRILDAIKKEVPADWLIGRTWDATHKEFAEIVKNGKFPDRVRFFELTIPDQKLFFQFLGTAISMGVLTASLVYQWASMTLGAEYIGAFGWAMIPLGGILSTFILMMDRKRRETQHNLIRAIRKDARRADQLLSLQRETAKIYRSLFTAFETAGYRRSGKILDVISLLMEYYSPFSHRRGKQEVIDALENESPPILRSGDDKFRILFALTPSGDQPTTIEALIQEVHKRIQHVQVSLGEPAE